MPTFRYRIASNGGGAAGACGDGDVEASYVVGGGGGRNSPPRQSPSSSSPFKKKKLNSPSNKNFTDNERSSRLTVACITLVISIFINYSIMFQQNNLTAALSMEYATRVEDLVNGPPAQHRKQQQHHEFGAATDPALQQQQQPPTPFNWFQSMQQQQQSSSSSGEPSSYQHRHAILIPYYNYEDKTRNAYYDTKQKLLQELIIDLGVYINDHFDSNEVIFDLYVVQQYQSPVQHGTVTLHPNKNLVNFNKYIYLKGWITNVGIEYVSQLHPDTECVIWYEDITVRPYNAYDDTLNVEFTNEDNGNNTFSSTNNKFGFPVGRVPFDQCNVPMLLSNQLSHYRYHLPIIRSSGFVLSMNVEHWKGILNGIPNHYTEEVIYMDSFQKAARTFIQQVWHNFLYNLLAQTQEQQNYKLLHGLVRWDKGTIPIIQTPERHCGIFEYFGYKSKERSQRKVGERVKPHPPTVIYKHQTILPWSKDKVKGIQDIEKTVDRLVHVKPKPPSYSPSSITNRSSATTALSNVDEVEEEEHPLALADEGLFASFHHILVTPLLKLRE